MSNHFAPEHVVSYLHERGISTHVAQESGLRPLPADGLRREVFGPDDSAPYVPGDGLLIPYLELDGTTPILGQDGLPFVRARVFDPRKPKELPPNGRLVRYIAAPNAGYRPYLPPGLNRLMEHSPRLLVVTEGEIKAVAAVAAGISCIGIGGVGLWMHPESHQPGADITHETAVHPQILEAVQKIGSVVVLADSDANKNDNVRIAMTQFTEALRHQAPGATVVYARCKDPAKRGAKQGLDDWLVTDGVKNVEGFLLWLLKKERAAQAARLSGGYKPLGYDDRGYFVWSIAKGTLETVGKEKLTNSSLLMSICGLDWCEAKHPRATESGNVSADWTRIGGAIAKDCEALGPFTDDMLRGPGVWRHAHNPDVLVINSSDIWRSDGAHIDRVTDAHVYPRSKSLGLSPEVCAGSVDDAKEVLSALETFSWTRRSDSLLMLGWLGLGYVAGALEWRPHLSLTGPRGTGKSTLMALLRKLLGRACIYTEGNSTEAGIRQAVRSAAPALLLDEGEADGYHLGKILEFLRVASTGGTQMKGTGDQQGAKYTLRALGCLAGINPPAMNAADASRFIRIELKHPSREVARQPHPFVGYGSTGAEEVGPRLFARAISAWPRFLQAAKEVRKHLAGPDDRSLDTMTPAIAMAWCLLNDGKLDTPTAFALAASVDISDDFARIKDAEEGDDMLTLLMTRAVQTSAGGASQKKTIGDIIDAVAAAKCKGAWYDELRTYGIKVVRLGGTQHELRINPRASEFVGLLKGTKFERADLAEALRRQPGADRKSAKTDRISGGSAPVRYVSITIDIEPSTLSAIPGPINPADLV